MAENMVDGLGVTVISWNAANAFSPDRSEEHRQRAFEYVEGLGDRVDVLCIPELMGPGADDRHLDAIQGQMSELGYTRSVMTHGVRPDGLYVSIWSRIEGETGAVDLGDNMSLPYIVIPGLCKAIGIHGHSDMESARVDVAERLVGYLTGGTSLAEDMGDTVLFGDSNSTRSRDKGNARLLRTADRIVEMLPSGLIDFEKYYHGPKRLSLAGVALRALPMVRGGSMDVYERAGFAVADPAGRPTVFYRIPLVGRLRVDQIMATEQGLQLSDFKRYSCQPADGGNPLSDHVAIGAMVSRRSTPHQEALLETLEV